MESFVYSGAAKNVIVNVIERSEQLRRDLSIENIDKIVRVLLWISIMLGQKSTHEILS